MKELPLPNVTLMASVASFFIQIGGQVFALIVVDSTLVEAPPRSFAILQERTVTIAAPFGVWFPRSPSCCS
jgi:hypothetical protein